jgi:hypothetical protein
MSFLNIFHPSYYLDTNLGYTFDSFWLVFGVFVALIVGAAFWRMRFKKVFADRLKGKVFYHIYASMLTLGIIGLIWLGLRFEQVMYFNLRLWPALASLYLLASLVYAVYFMRWRYPKLMVAKTSRAERDRFLKMSRRK